MYQIKTLIIKTGFSDFTNEKEKKLIVQKDYVKAFLEHSEGNK